MEYYKLTSIFVLYTLMINCSPRLSQEIIAHRGASYLAPENTVAAVRLGYEMSADAVEIDVHLTKDKKIVVNHDPTTARTAPGSDFTIRETMADDLRSLDVGSWKNEEFKGERMPFIEEIFEVVPKKKILVIEVKSDTTILPYLKQKVQESKKKKRFVLISFNKDVVVQWKEMMPEMPVFWLLHSFNHYTQEQAIDIAKEANLNGLNVFHGLINPNFMKSMKDVGLKVYVYTVNDAELAKSLKEAGVDAITTDRPQWIRKSFQ